MEVPAYVPLSPPPARKKSPWMIVALVVIPILLLCVIALGVVSIQSTLKATAQAATISENATAIARSEATVRAQKTLAAQAQSTIQALEDKAAAVPPGFEMTLLKDPLDGSLIHNAADTKINIQCASVDVDNFVVSAQFTNPYSSTEHAFDHGFRFKTYYRVFISSSGTLHFRNVGSTTTSIWSATVDSIRLGAGQTNDLTVVVKDDAVFISLNGQFVTTAYAEGLSATTGDICIGSGFFSEHEVTGKTTDYSGFTIWTLP